MMAELITWAKGIMIMLTILTAVACIIMAKVTHIVNLLKGGDGDRL